MSAVPAPLRLPGVTAPDRDFAAAREAALAVVASEAHAAWTDHNAPDPGVTLLEAVAWGVADLHYRTAARGFGAWPLEVPADALPAEPHWSAVPLAADPAGLLELAAALAAPASDGRTVAMHLADAIAGSGTTSSRDAATAIAGRAFAADAAVPALTWPQAAAAVRLLRGSVVLRGALDGSEVVAAALAEAGGDDDRAVAILRTEPVVAGLWEDELRGLLRRTRRLDVASRVQALAPVIAATGDPAATIAELTTAHGLSTADAEVAIALHPCPHGLEPEAFEHADGTTRVWPPHPLQARTCEPITAEDYARRARTAPGVRRAWALPGIVLAPGVGWDGALTVATAVRAGAVTLLVESAAPLSPTTQPAFLRDVLRVVLGPVAEVDDPFALWRDGLHEAPPRRTICDEVGAAMLQTCPVTVKGVLHASAGGDRTAVVDRARARVAAFFAEGRAESRPGALAALECPGSIEGSWPPAPQPEDGWTPGDPIRLSELVQRLADDPLVIGIEGLQIAIGDGEWLPNPGITGHVELPPQCVPVLADRRCMRVKLALATECGHG